jgi:hypothetical protein
MNNSPNLNDSEEHVRQETCNREEEILTVIEQLLNLHLAGFRQLDGFKRIDDNKREQVWLFLTSRAFNSLRWAYHLLQYGYYPQALILTRSALEDWLACMDCEVNEKTIEALLSQGQRVPGPGDMAVRLPEPLRRQWKDIEGEEGLYGFLSTFSHPRHRAVIVMLNPKTKTLRIGPEYDEILFVVSAYHILNCAARITKFLGRLVTNPTESDWGSKNVKVCQEVEKCLNDLAERAKAEPSEN